MFTIKSNYDKTISINNNSENVRNYFAETRHFVEQMDGVESITAVSNSQNRWVIRVDFPIIGSIKQEFNVDKTEDSTELLEWSPSPNEKQNFLRYSADFQSIGDNETNVRLVQMVELRRDKASQLHFLAGMAGESTISREMGNHIGAMLDKFMQTAKIKLEN